MTKWTLGIIGGSGLYEIDGLEDRREDHVQTIWGAPSDTLVRGRIGPVELVFLPRHGKGHRLSPSTVPCGSLKEQYVPGHFVAVDQFIDRTVTRESTFFGPGMVAHVSIARPVCSRLAALAADSAEAVGATMHRGGTYLAMEGPQFSSLAESRLYRQWGCDVIGMTGMPEAKLAREAELPYATLAMVTDYDCWREEEEAVSVTNVLEIMGQNSALARQAVGRLATELADTPRTASPDGIETCLDYALITAPTARDPALLEKLQVIAGRALGG